MCVTVKDKRSDNPTLIPTVILTAMYRDPDYDHNLIVSSLEA